MAGRNRHRQTKKDRGEEKEEGRKEKREMSLLAGLPQSLVGKLQRVQNSAARLIVRALPRVHITPVLRHLHRLPV